MKREAARAIQEEYNFLSIFWPLKLCSTVDMGFSPTGEAYLVHQDKRLDTTEHA